MNSINVFLFQCCFTTYIYICSPGAPLFDSSSNFTDPQTLQLLQHSQRLLTNLSTIFHCLLSEAQELTQKGATSSFSLGSHLCLTVINHCFPVLMSINVVMV